ncbi:MAG TPA: hypothetical protein VH764_06495 [Gemmatimonadales bacterium]|jgi:hypothetical protein
MRHLVSYLLFVGVPLAGLLGVIRVGQGIEAPLAVHGAWAVQPMPAPGRVCTRYLLSGADSSLTISQSGRELTAVLGPADEVALRGALDGDELALEGAIQPGATPRTVACTVGDTVRLEARVSSAAPLRVLEASLWFSGCPECGPTEFTVARPNAYHKHRRAP